MNEQSKICDTESCRETTLSEVLRERAKVMQKQVVEYNELADRLDCVTIGENKILRNLAIDGLNRNGVR